MTCSRCNGCMVEDFLLDMEDSSGPMWLQAKRCMNCGNVAEKVLEHNRQTQGAALHSAKSAPTIPNSEHAHFGSGGMAQLAA
ncbi:MAG TPA: hypothetical protein PK614_02430 [Nitrospira sp.]|nr:hypothetical protein [Nitrospira sp.]